MKKLYTFLIIVFIGFVANAQIINIPDANFKAKLLEANESNQIATSLNWNSIKIDANNNGEIEVSEALMVYHLEVDLSNIHSVIGINNFTNLQEFYCSGNQITDIDITSLTNLYKITCNENQITNLNVSGLTNLAIIICENNHLSEINLNGLTNLQRLYCGYNLFATLTISNLPHFELLWCDHNQITSLNLSNLPVFGGVNADDNLLTSLDLSGMPSIHDSTVNNNLLTSVNLTGLTHLELFNCSNNLFTTLDFTDFQQLGQLICNNSSQLTSLFIKGTQLANYLQFSDCPNLQYICTNDDFIPYIQDIIDGYGYTNCNVNSYCSFTPGGTYYTINGQVKLDINNNGCDNNDLVFSELKFSITDGTHTGEIIANNSGGYSIPVQAGSHTIVPILENPSYFNISPTSVNVTFPNQTSPFVQNFCVTPNGLHQDLEVTLVPLTIARPGFDARYKLVYKNKGTSIQSGAVTFAFNDNKIDFVSSSSIPTSQSFGVLSWDYAYLLPLESREITVILNINSPMEIPAVNAGDILNSTAVIYPITGDELAIDNTSSLKQLVVNSLDPNDKICLEGENVGPEMIGEYVHYLIRFENTGTYPAENIVVKDIIDTTKFDVSTLVPLNGSHPFITRVTDDNKAEFIFENINLPFDDANNDGFVAFKIKTKPTLAEGDTFSNTADIYFDYNFPITTNTATTTIQTLGTQDFEFSSVFSLSPVPTRNLLTITTKQTVEISSVTIYNSLGQLIQVNTNPNETIDVSNLVAGTYFLKINSNKGTAASKFIKK